MASLIHSSRGHQRSEGALYRLIVEKIIYVYVYLISPLML